MSREGIPALWFESRVYIQKVLGGAFDWPGGEKLAFLLICILYVSTLQCFVYKSMIIATDLFFFIFLLLHRAYVLDIVHFAHISLRE
jgi:hypothetical protein